MLSQKWTKLIKSLQVKKYRKLEQSFVTEGGKSVLELIQSDYKVTIVLVTARFKDENSEILRSKNFAVEVVSEEELEKLGTFQSNNAALAVAEMKPNQILLPKSNEMLLALDGIQDPGNLGTIIRIADWYGIKKLICSEDTVDFYNPKTISATMGSFTRTQLYYCNLVNYLNEYKSDIISYGAFLEGKSVYETDFTSSGVIVMGNEAHGIRPELEPVIAKKINIPRFGSAESLNVAIATAIICDNWRRSLHRA
ncbi:RNA methyltransferase [Cytophagaceae bacterium DM2B3-1]|uniref:RNA methyltransferase n=1 Tax=Xanthocytophaga flava TaxID=3048013 RepID=A0ABT7CFF7_9BACT|nr:RNA methyltransferase [Xanthocytophaga flavus]MDJ1472949.1 RNA methyltransferase [Xanthocytophaga flavus]MDJ1492372.1 RNA methyltransferase [Xanthocytophaga flavus]